MRRAITICGFAAVCWGVSAFAMARPVERGTTMIQPFDYHGVTLNDSHLKRQFDDVRDFYLRIPNDDLLRGYRIRAGLPAPGADMGGNYLGHNPFGQIMSGLSRMYAASGDIACKEKAEALLRGWAECLAPDGFFFIVSEPVLGLEPYYYDKMVCGLVDLYLYCGTEAALSSLRLITEWAVEHLSRDRLYARPTGEGGGEWYTLSENLYRAYLATGESQYREFAEVWEYREFWDLFANKDDIFQHPLNGGWYHAYSHVNSLNGLAAAFLVKGNDRDAEALKNAYDFLWDTQLWATGGYGPNETLMPRGKLLEMLTATSNHFETQCGSWAAFKLAKYLMRFTGDARYGDWIELLIMNGIGASIPMDPEGNVFYYSEYHLGGSAKRNSAPWACCTGTRTQAVADFHDLIYFHDADNLYVNLTTPSTVTWERGNGKVTVRQVTRFPESPTTEFVVSADRASEFGLKLRVPGWLTGPLQAAVNGEAVPAPTDDLNWATIRREWQDGDRLTVRLPMEFRVSRMMPGDDVPAALMYGPVTMAVRCLDSNPSNKFDLSNISASLVPVAGDRLNYRLAADASVLVRPFYQFKKGERYVVYLDPVHSRYRVPYTAAVFSPGWRDFGGWMATNVIGSTAEYTFEGTGIRVFGYFYDDAGKIQVAIDGKVVGVIDQYGPNRGEPHDWEFAGLAPGKHTIGLLLLPEKAAESKGTYVNLAAFEPGD